MTESVRMVRIACLISTAILIAGCALEPLRPAFDRVQLGKPLPDKLPLPDGVRWSKSGRFWCIEHCVSPLNSYSDNSLTIELDDNGRVRSKRYKYRWDIDYGLVGHSYGTGEEYRFEQVPLSLNRPARDGRAADRSGETARFCGDRVQLLGGDRESIERSLVAVLSDCPASSHDISCARFESLSLIPGIQARTCALKVNSAGDVTIVLHENSDVSWPIYTLWGYAHLIVTGRLPC